MATFDEVQHEISNILDSLETAEPLVVKVLQDELDAYLEDLATMEADKADAIAFMIRQQQARIDLLKSEEQRIRGRCQAAERQLARTKDYFKSVMEKHSLQKVKGNSSTLYLRKSEKVEINIFAELDPAENLPGQFVKVKTTYEVDKAAIKSALKDGEDVPNCSLVETFNLNVR